MKTNNSQWKKRSEIFRAIYSDILNEQDPSVFLKICFEDLNFDRDQIELIEIYLKNKDEFINLISKNLKESWTYDRLPIVDKAIILTALSEAKLSKYDKKIIISQAVITTKHYSNPNNKNFINAILDKIIKNNYEAKKETIK